jgi:hypothetical protein
MKSTSLIKYFLLSILIIETSQEWLSQVSGFDKNDANNGYAGIFGRPIIGLRVSGGKQYRVHIKGGSWLPAVTGNNINDANNGYAGNDKVIDAVAISGGVKYLVHIQGGKWLPAVTGYNINDSYEGYAGVFGQAIDAIMIKGRTYAVSVSGGSSGGSSGDGSGSDQPKSKTAAATEIYKFFKGKGWSKNAICGILGNIEVETAYTFNPDIHAYNGDGGYGLLQWTPGSKLRDWANSKGLNFKTINTQCQRLQYEYENGIQYYASNNCGLTFGQYIKSNNSPDYLAECFMHNYERPNLYYANIPTRRQKAIDWCNYF